MSVDVDLGSLHVLVVDDSRYARTLVASALSSFGVRRVSEAADTATAFDLLQSADDIGLVIVAFDLLPMDGVEFTRSLRRGAAGRDDVPVIMVSGVADPSCVRDARNAGVNEFLALPLSAESLQRRIRTLLLNPRPFIRAPGYVGPCRRTLDRPQPESGERRKAPPAPRPPRQAAAAPPVPEPPARTSRKRFRAGAVIFREGETGDEAYVVEQGRVAIRKEADGQTVTLGTVGPDGVFGEMALIDGAARMASAMADEDTVCMVLPKVVVDSQIRRSPDLVALVVRTLLSNIRSMGRELAQTRAAIAARREEG